MLATVVVLHEDIPSCATDASLQIYKTDMLDIVRVAQRYRVPSNSNYPGSSPGLGTFSLCSLKKSTILSKLVKKKALKVAQRLVPVVVLLIQLSIVTSLTTQI